MKIPHRCAIGHHIFFGFGSSPAPVPEPSSLLLLLTAAAHTRFRRPAR
ncbi:MAG: PEP-CTERM sorting domain-containing protein [Candidatus Competibacterales bacterium]